MAARWLFRASILRPRSGTGARSSVLRAYSVRLERVDEIEALASVAEAVTAPDEGY